VPPAIRAYRRGNFIAPKSFAGSREILAPALLHRDSSCLHPAVGDLTGLVEHHWLSLPKQAIKVLFVFAFPLGSETQSIVVIYKTLYF
jgi:hypothetical protein